MRLLGDDIVPNPIVVTNHALDWSWAVVLLPLEDGPRTRFLFRSGPDRHA
jgi:phosphopantothenate synthetase